MSDIKTALTQYNNAMDALEEAETRVQDTLKCVKEAAGSATIDVAGQFFQVRKRKDKFYLCELTGKPRGRPKGSKNTKPKKGSVPPLEAVDTMNVVDVFSTDVLLDQADAVPDAAIAVLGNDVTEPEAVAEDAAEVYEEIPETTGVRTVVETLDSASA